MSVCVCCVLSGTGLSDELITRLDESYKLWRVDVCDLDKFVAAVRPQKQKF